MSTTLEPGSESKFIHDLGSPLGTIVIVVATVLDELREKGNSDLKEQIEQLEKVSEVLDRVSGTISARRQQLLSDEKKGF